jgi:Flp pilus assembly protein TadD
MDDRWIRLMESARTSERRGNFDAAVSAYSDVRTSNPECGPALFGLGMLHLRRGAASAARFFLENAIAAEPDAAEYRLQLAALLVSLGDFDAAARYDLDDFTNRSRTIHLSCGLTLLG